MVTTRSNHAAFFFTLLTGLAACNRPPESLEAFAGGELRRSEDDQGLIVRVLREGRGAPAGDGDTVRVHYLLTLGDATVVESSHDGDPLTILLGYDPGYIEGLHRGLRGCRADELREVIVPPALGYRGRAMAKIPPTAMLHFSVQVVEVVPSSAPK